MDLVSSTISGQGPNSIRFLPAHYGKHEAVIADNCPIGGAEPKQFFIHPFAVSSLFCVLPPGSPFTLRFLYPPDNAYPSLIPPFETAHTHKWHKSEIKAGERPNAKRCPLQYPLLFSRGAFFPVVLLCLLVGGSLGICTLTLLPLVVFFDLSRRLCS